MNVFQCNQNCFQSYPMTKPCQDKSPKLFEPQEAIMLGNLFKDLYMSYHGFSNYCIQPQNKRQQDLLEVQMYSFVAHEINLYLDMHPKNKRMIQLYTEYAKKANEAQKVYEETYGALSVENSLNKSPFEWVQGPWPWEYQC